MDTKPAAIQRNFNFKIQPANGNELTPKSNCVMPQERT